MTRRDTPANRIHALEERGVEHSMERDVDYGRLPPKKLKRFKELIESGLENPKDVTEENLNEVAKLFLKAGASFRRIWNSGEGG